jgi:hypothetical protein
MAMTPKKREMVCDQVNSKVYWGTEDEEVLQWLGSRHGIFGDEAQKILSAAKRAKRAAVRKRSILYLIGSGIGMVVTGGFWYIASGAGGRGGIRISQGTAVLGGAALACAGVFFKSLHALLTGETVGPVE